MDPFSVLMTHAVTVAGQTSSTDSGAGTQVSYTTRTTGVACLLRADGGGSRDVFSQEQLPRSYTLATYTTSFERGDRVTVTAGPDLVGVVLRVTGIKTQPGVEFLGIASLCYVSCETFQ